MKTWPTTGTVPPTGRRAGGGPPQAAASRVSDKARRAGFIQGLAALYPATGGTVPLQNQRDHLGVRTGRTETVCHRDADRARGQDAEIGVGRTERARARTASR